MAGRTQLANAGKGRLPRTAPASRQTPAMTAPGSPAVPGRPHLNNGTQAPAASARAPGSRSHAAWSHGTGPAQMHRCPELPRRVPRDLAVTGPVNTKPGTGCARRALPITGQPLLRAAQHPVAPQSQTPWARHTETTRVTGSVTGEAGHTPWGQTGLGRNPGGGTNSATASRQLHTGRQPGLRERRVEQTRLCPGPGPRGELGARWPPGRSQSVASVAKPVTEPASLLLGPCPFQHPVQLCRGQDPRCPRQLCVPIVSGSAPLPQLSGINELEPGTEGAGRKERQEGE